MKIIATAIALAFALPAAAAQPAPAGHQGHDQQPQGQPAQGHQGHDGHGQGQHPQGGHQGGHQNHGDGCCADRDGNGRMDCCEQAEGESRACEHHGSGH